MPVKYGLIAEDLSDIEVLKTLARKVTGKSFSASHFVGKGCGPLRRKALGWCKSFHHKGCTRVLLVHDRDQADATKLRGELETILADAPQQRKVVVIPIEELEAWLLSDHDAVARALNLRHAFREVHHPEQVQSPKEHLAGLVWKASEKRVQYVNTVHNGLIADQIDVSKISAKCPSFGHFRDFVDA